MTQAAALHEVGKTRPGLVHGVNPAGAVAAIKDRAARWGRGLREPDGRKLGLVIEGGAMRAVCSGGGAVALAHLGFTDIFDEVYATSAGVMNASYFLSHQAELGISVYFEDLVTQKFMNPLRVWKVLDVDYVIDQIVTFDKPLDVNKVLASRTRFFVAVIDKLTGDGTMIDTQAGHTPLLHVLKAAMAMPVLYNRTVDVNGRQCMDGGMAIPFPVKEALASGCTDLLVLLTRPANYFCPAPGWASKHMFDLICARGNDRLLRTYSRRHECYSAARDLAFGRCATPPGVNIATICTDEPEQVDRTTLNRTVLRAAAVRYGRNTLGAFAAASDAWDLGSRARITA